MIDYDALYQSVWRHNYDIQPIRAMRYRFTARALKGVFKRSDVTSALDVGCGVGEIPRLMLGLKPNVEVTGIDISSEAIELAKTNCPAGSFIVSDLESFQPARTYDLITAIDVIEHIEDDRAALQKINSLLRNGGAIVLSLPHSMSYWTEQDERGGHYRRYAKAEIVGKLRGAGFDIVQIHTYGFPLPLLYSYAKNTLARFRRCNEEELKKNPGLITRIAAALLKRLFLICELDIGIGLHLLVVARKLER